jgi:hypothetical protein
MAGRRARRCTRRSGAIKCEVRRERRGCWAGGQMKWRLLIVVVLSTFLAACGGESKSPAAPSRTVTSLAINGSASLTNPGQTTQLAATAALSDGTTQNVTNSVAWQSSNPEVATVSDRGLATAVGMGTAQISATYQGRAGSLSVQVLRPVAVAFVFSPSPAVRNLPTVFQTIASGDVGLVVDYLWIFGDGIAVTAAGPNSTVSHVYPRSGTYVVAVAAQGRSRVVLAGDTQTIVVKD